MTIIFVVVPKGVKKAVEALTAKIIIKGTGEYPNCMAAAITMGAIKMEVAELLII